MLWWVVLPGSALIGTGWIFSGSFYALDLILAHQLLYGWVVLACMMCGVLLRRWRWVALMVPIFALAIWPVARGRTMILPHVVFGEKDQGVIRVISCNINPLNERWEEDLDALMRLDADVIVLLEAPVELSIGARRRGLLDQTPYPNWLHRSWVEHETSPCFVLSRWPLEQLENEPGTAANQHVLHTIVRMPVGDVVVGLMHPLSPRTAGRWHQGNEAVELQSYTAKETLERSALPLVIGVDLNSGPAQWRGRALYRSDLRMSKPLLRMGGSFPSNGAIPEALMIQLDDVWHAGGIRPVAWEMFTLRGSDHRAICVDYLLD